MTICTDELRGHVPVMRVTLLISISPSSTCAGIEEVSLYITALVHHLWGMSERDCAKGKVDCLLKVANGGAPTNV